LQKFDRKTTRFVFRVEGICSAPGDAEDGSGIIKTIIGKFEILHARADMLVNAQQQ